MLPLLLMPLYLAFEIYPLDSFRIGNRVDEVALIDQPDPSLPCTYEIVKLNL